MCKNPRNSSHSCSSVERILYSSFSDCFDARHAMGEPEKRGKVRTANLEGTTAKAIEARHEMSGITEQRADMFCRARAAFGHFHRNLGNTHRRNNLSGSGEFTEFADQMCRQVHGPWTPDSGLAGRDDVYRVARLTMRCDRAEVCLSFPCHSRPRTRVHSSCVPRFSWWTVRRACDAMRRERGRDPPVGILREPDDPIGTVAGDEHTAVFSVKRHNANKAFWDSRFDTALLDALDASV